MGKLALISENDFTDVCICQNLATWIFWICPIYCVLIFALVQLLKAVFIFLRKKWTRIWSLLWILLLIIKKPQNKKKTQLVGDWVSLENAPFKPSLLCSCLMHLVQQVGGAWLPTHRPLPCNGSDFAFCFSFHLDIGIEAEVYDWRPSSGWASCRLANCTPFTGAENVPVTLKAARCVALIYRVTVMLPQHSPWSQGKILDSIQHWSWGSFRKSWFRLSST